MESVQQPPRWSVRSLFEAPGPAPAWVGLGLAAAILAIFFLLELALGRFEAASPRDMWLSVTHIVISIYLLTAYVYAERASDSSLSALLSGANVPAGEAALRRTPSQRFALSVAAVAGLLVSFVATWNSPGDVSLWPSRWSPEVVWHRLLGPFMGFWTARLVALLAIDSARLSRATASIRDLDLLDLGPLTPATQYGLTNALLLMGMVGAYGFFLFDLRFLGMVGGIVLTAVIASTFALLRPVWGAHRCIQERKRAELVWCRDRIRAARAALDEPGNDRERLDELVAWEGRIQAVREWPFDSSPWARFALYLLIPLASWSGGAFVERLFDRVLD
jgi:hypothetical protein